MTKQGVQLIVCCCTLCLSFLQAQTVTLGSLLDEMIDTERLTRLPEHPYRLLHASSYDRRAQQPYTADWFANTDKGTSDGANYIRVETNGVRKEFVFMDAEGPGVIVRFWVTTWQDGADPILRIYFDNSPIPVIEGALTQIIGRHALAERPFSFVTADTSEAYTYLVGHNLYLPIPFASRCKVTVENPSSSMYYNIDYRLYDTQVPVETYATNSLVLYATQYHRTLAALSNRHPACVACVTNSIPPARLKRESGITQLQLEGPAVLRQISLQLQAADVMQALRSTHLEIDFDGETNAVHCPVGDFFGTDGTVSTGFTWFAEVRSNHILQAFWPMPFERSATLRLVNHGFQPVDVVHGEILWGPYQWQTNSLHFHAAWREYVFEDSLSNVNGWKGEDLTYISLTGRGRLVGDSLSIFNDVSTNYARAWDNWWGEGDEKIYVNGETFPSHFGTGTEDYYGYAWCGAYLFNTPFISLPQAYGNDQTGKAINTRVRLLDDLPYRTGLRFDMELMHNQTGRHRFAPAVFWYASPGGSCDNPDPLAASQLPVARSKTSGIEYATNACPVGIRREFDAMTIARKSGGTTLLATTNGWGLSQGKCLFWNACNLGDSLTLEFQAAFSNACTLAFKMISLPTSGSLSISLNGSALTNTINLTGVSGRPFTLLREGEPINQGTNQLHFQVTALPPEASTADFVFDYLENRGPYDLSRIWPPPPPGTVIFLHL